MNTPEQSELGRTSVYKDQYDPGLLFPIARQDKRSEIGIAGQPPFFGADLWTAFELSWLNAKGKPQVALAHVVVPCESPNIVESKSFKLYLNSLNNSRFADATEVQARLKADLTEAVWRQGDAPRAGAAVGVKLVLPEGFGREGLRQLQGLSLDRLDIECDRYTPAPDLLTAAFDESPVSEVLVSDLLRQV